MSASYPRRSVRITMEMIRFAVEELQMKRDCVSLNRIACYFLKRYPVKRNFFILKDELRKELDHAVSLGFLSRTDTDTYCLSSFRTEAYSYKTNLSSFWERYYKKMPGRRLKPPSRTKKNEPNRSRDGSDDSSSDYYSDDYSDSDY